MIASEIAAPLQDAVGDGGLYSMWAGLFLLVICMVWTVILKGKTWREHAEKVETASRTKGASMALSLHAPLRRPLPAAAPCAS